MLKAQSNVGANRNGQMLVDTKVNGKIIKGLAMVSSGKPKKIVMRESGAMIKPMDLASICA